MSTGLRLSRMHFPVTALGPGRRLGLWFQGCSIRCPGCVSRDTWATGGPGVPVESVVEAAAAWAAEADGLTVSGGEPFDQPDALLELLRRLRPRLRPEADVLVYTGHPRERVERHLARAHPLIDALISDPFVAAAPQTLWLRGSDNQRLHRLTPLGRARYRDRPRGPEDDRLDLMHDEDGTVWMAGLPRRGDLDRLLLLLSREGATARTTEHRP